MPNWCAAMGTSSFPPGMHDCDTKSHDLIEGMSQCMISRKQARAIFKEYREAQGSHYEVYTDGSKMNERVLAAAVINRYFQDGETTCRQLSKRLPDNSTIFAAEATAITLALDHYQHTGPVHHDVVVYSASMTCLQVIEGEGTEKTLICHFMNLHWLLSDKGTHINFCWIPSRCDIEGRSRQWPTGKCPLFRLEATDQLLHSAVGSNQFGCNWTWQIYFSRETNTGATVEISALSQSWRSYTHTTSIWLYKTHEVLYLVSRTTDCLSPLWSNTEHCPYALGMCSVTVISWRILHSWLIEYSLRDNSRDLHSGIPARSGILLSDMMQFFNFNYPPDLDNIIGLE